MDWYVGERDEVGVSWPLDWSALGAARSGQGVYARAGFSATRLTYVPGDHYSYQFAQLLEQSLNKAQARPSTLIPSLELLVSATAPAEALRPMEIPPAMNT